MRVLIVGGGGREHALAWKVAQSSVVRQVYVAPGNAGTAREPKVRNVPLAAGDLAGLRRFARDQGIGLTIVGPEAPLVAGIVDEFQEAGLRIFGPGRQAAQLEGSKVFCKAFLERHAIPTATFASFSDEALAIDYIRAQGAPIVVKADGLAAGKGVILAQDEVEAIQAVKDMLSGGAFGGAGSRVVVESLLHGEEASFICMVEGEHILAMASSQDHKARDAGDKGPNTGGLGAYSPAPVLSSEIHRRVMREVIEPTVKGLAREGAPYTGFLYAGLMISPEGQPQVLEYNCRLGDPETQPILMRLESDLVSLCDAALDGRLDRLDAEWDSRAAVGVVLAAGGYPGSYRNGEVITGLEGLDSPDLKVFHAGTALKDDQVLTNGGRVLCVTALGRTVGEAQRRAYEGVSHIHWEGMYYRPDIGYRAIAREQYLAM